ncbi:MAG: 3-oxoacyl-ACP synthase [bacterium]
MNSTGTIKNHCVIRGNQVTLGPDTWFQADSHLTFQDFIVQLYKRSGIDYPKFYKMDPLSRLGFMTAELLLEEGGDLKSCPADRTAVIVANASSSIETDGKFNETIVDPSHYFPSPALFVYTLPNIFIGEICIKNNIKGENTCFISESFNTGFICDYVNRLLGSGKADRVICGWVDLDRDYHYESILYLVEKEPDGAKSAEHRIFNVRNADRLFRED